METKIKLLTRISEFCAARGISESTFAGTVVNDGKFVKRLKNGGSCTLELYDRILSYIADAEKSAQ